MTPTGLGRFLGVAVLAVAGAIGGLAQAAPSEAEVLEELAKDMARYQEAVTGFRQAANVIIKRAYQEKIRSIKSKYESQIGSNENDERTRREDAIVVFEKFLVKYPNDARWTPDAMFRLAELHYEKSADAFLTAQEAFQKSFESTTNAPQAEPPKPDYSKTVALYQKLLTDFPSYRLLDAAYYLLGYCLGEMGKEAEGRQVLLALTCSNRYKPLDPPQALAPSQGGVKKGVMNDPYKGCEPVKKESKFVPEAWTRIGEQHFDSAELAEAISAYQKVLDYKDSPYYDKALYKLAWSYYRDNRYLEAVREFDGLVKWADQRKAAGDKFGSDLRPEAVQYLAISFSEPDWDGDTVTDVETGLQRLDTFYKGRESEPHVKEIYQKLADAYFDQTKYADAIAVYRSLLAKWPFYSDAPRVQEKVVKAYERDRNMAMASKEREILGRNYTKGTEWFRQNQDNPEAMAIAQQLSEDALLIAATNIHAAAQACKEKADQAKDPTKLVECRQMYKTSSELYERYLAAYPNSKQSYEFSMYYADALYYSLQYEAAINAYTNVRDSVLDNRNQVLAAFMIIKSFEDIIDGMKNSKQLDDPPIPDEKNTTPPVAPLAMPEVYQRYLSALDWYTNNLKDDKVPDLRYAAAVLQLRYRMWPEARGRLMLLSEAYCKDKPETGFRAYDALLKTYFIDYKVQDEELQDCALGRLLTVAEMFGESPCSKQPQAGPYMTRLREIRTSVKSSVISKRLQLAKENEEKGTDRQLAVCRAGGGGIAIVTGVATAKPGVPGAATPGGAPAGKLSTELDEGLALDLIDLVNENPKDPDAAKNLNNACYTYQKVYKFGEATKCYEQLAKSYPESGEGRDAVWMAAKAHEQFFDFDDAVRGYLKIATDPKFATYEHRKEALGLAATLLDNDQQYGRAAQLYRQYSDTLTEKPTDAAQSFLFGCTALEKQKELAKQRQCLNDLIRKYSNQPPAGESVIEAYMKLAVLTEQTSKSRSDVLRAYQKVRDEFIARKLPPATEAADAAAKAEYLLLEQQFNDFKGRPLRITQSKQAQKVIETFINDAKTLQEEFKKVWDYKRATWTLAASLKRGDIFYEFGQKLLKAADSPPDDLVQLAKKACGKDQACKDETMTAYKDAIAQYVSQVEEVAKKEWKATLERAAQLGVTNQYVKAARENLSKYLPDEFPFVKDEKPQMEQP